MKPSKNTEYPKSKVVYIIFNIILLIVEFIWVLPVFIEVPTYFSILSIISGIILIFIPFIPFKLRITEMTKIQEIIKNQENHLNICKTITSIEYVYIITLLTIHIHIINLGLYFLLFIFPICILFPFSICYLKEIRMMKQYIKPEQK